MKFSLLFLFLCCINYSIPQGIDELVFKIVFDDEPPPRPPPRPGSGSFGRPSGPPPPPPPPSPENFQQTQPRNPDCTTYENQPGFCIPLTSCDVIGQILLSKGPISAARFLRRSLCGLTIVLPNVCCPRSGGGEKEEQQGPKPTAPPPPPPPPPSTTRAPPPPSTTRAPPPPPPSTTKKPSFVPGQGFTLIPVQPSTAKPQQGLSDFGLPQDCGFSNKSTSKIVGGHPASKGAWPWIAALGYRDSSTGGVNFLCAGTLISDRWIVTASHCIHNRNDLVIARLGDHDLYTKSDGMAHIDMPVGQIIEHPKYNPSNYYNDIALVRLRDPVPFFSENIHPICLPTTPQLRNERYERHNPFVAGWGAVEFNGPSSSVLRQVQIPVVPEAECRQKFQSFKSVNVDHKSLCAGRLAGGKDSCQGDSGGPLMQPVSRNKFVLIGVVSFGYKCAEPGFPGIYSRVTEHLDWIESIVGKR